MFDDVTEGILQFSFPDFMLLVYRNILSLCANNLAKSTFLNANGMPILLNFLYMVLSSTNNESYFLPFHSFNFLFLRFPYCGSQDLQYISKYNDNS